MKDSSQRKPILWLIFALLLAFHSSAHADNTSTLTYQVFVDDKGAGRCKMRLQSDGGVDTVTVETDVAVKILLGTYRYSLRSKEVWKDGKLIEVESTSDDDGKKASLSAKAGERGLVVKRTGQTVALEQLTSTTGWFAPTAKAMNLFDTEDGGVQQVSVEKSTSKIIIGGKEVPLTRYRLKGGEVDSTWAYDENGKLTEQTMKWDGHRVRLILIESAK